MTCSDGFIACVWAIVVVFVVCELLLALNDAKAGQHEFRIHEPQVRTFSTGVVDWGDAVLPKRRMRSLILRISRPMSRPMFIKGWAELRRRLSAFLTSLLIFSLLARILLDMPCIQSSTVCQSRTTSLRRSSLSSLSSSAIAFDKSKS